MADQVYFAMYFDYKEHLKLLSHEARGRLLLALFEYAEHGTEPELSGAARMAFSFIRSQIDRDFANYRERCDRNRENGRRGGRPKQTEENPAVPDACGENPAQAEKAKTKEKEKTKENTKTSSDPLPPLSDRSQPLLQAANDWLAYKQERGEGYQPTGLKSLATNIRKHAEQYGDEAVAALIGECMAAGWKGIIWDRLGRRGPEKAGAPPNPAGQLTDWENEWAARVKAHRKAV